ncbi:hypothetical protein ACFL1Q_03100 [Patescibacteria group bacterium]
MAKAIKKLATYFIVWRLFLVFVALASILYIPRFSDNYLGGGLGYYLQNPLFWSWSNFDGEHYLYIVQNGYNFLQQAFFPAYPILIKALSAIFGTTLFSYNWEGLVISNILFFISLIVFWKVVKLNYSDKIANLAILTLLTFPTSFYFGAVYSESLFLLTSLLTYYLYKKEKYFFSGVVGIVMTASRVYGVFVLFAIFVDFISKKLTIKKIVKDKVYWMGLSIIGIVSFMYFSWKNSGDALAFYNLQTTVGEQHQKGVVLLPQVFYRYIKMLFLVKLPVYTIQTILLEITVGVMFILLPIYAYIKKVKLFDIVYILLGFLVPSAQGSFSSVPRYVAVIFPAFVVLALFLDRLPKLPKALYFILSSVWLMINTALFIRGYWVA